MEYHLGANVEKVVRRSGISIAELARRVKVNRRSIYNWFDQKHLSIETVAKIGYAIGHDFSTDFPELFSQYRLAESQKQSTQAVEANITDSIAFWKTKYILLLEKYNELLVSKKEFSEENAA